MSARDIRRAYLLMGFVAADLAMSLWDLWQARKRSKAWDTALEKEQADASAGREA